MPIRPHLQQRVLLPVLALIVLPACTRPATPVDLVFAARYGDANISCIESADGVQLTDLRFFVHDIRLLDASGNDADFHMADDGTWQDGVVALVDLENGQGACLNGSPEMNATIKGTVRSGPVHSISFRLGVPEDANHLDPMTAPPPRNYTAMHWHWLNGYKFVRAGVRTDTDGFGLHLGSSRCDGVPGSFSCRSPNRPNVTVWGFDPANNQVILDINKLFEGIDLKDNIAGDCSSGPDQRDCANPFRVLGLDTAQPSDALPGTFRAGPIG